MVPCIHQCIDPIYKRAGENTSKFQAAKGVPILLITESSKRSSFASLNTETFFVVQASNTPCHGLVSKSDSPKSEVRPTVYRNGSRLSRSPK